MKRESDIDRLHSESVSFEDLKHAVEDRRLALLPVERLLSAEARYSAREVAEKSGLDLEFAMVQVWRLDAKGKCVWVYDCCGIERTP